MTLGIIQYLLLCILKTAKIMKNTCTLFSLEPRNHCDFWGAGMELNTDPSGERVDTYFLAPPRAPIKTKDLVFNSLIMSCHSTKVFIMAKTQSGWKSCFTCNRYSFKNNMTVT